MGVSYSNSDRGLEAMFETDPEPYARQAAHVGGAELKRRAEDATPVRSGAVKRGWRQLPVDRSRSLLGPSYESRIENRHPRAAMTERGAQAHIIEPNDQQAVTPEGRPRARVEHPGFDGAFMSQKAAATVERDAEAIVEPVIESFAAEVERKTEQGH